MAERELGRKNREEEEEGEQRKKPKKVIRPKCTFRPKHSEILSEVEWGGVSYRFPYRYEIFRPFRPERNGIYNIDSNIIVHNFCKTILWFHLCNNFIIFYLNQPKSLQNQKRQTLLFLILTKINQTHTNIKPNKFYSQIQSNPNFKH